MQSDLLAMKLYLADDGNVWYINGDGPPTNSGKSLIPFMLHAASRHPRLRIMGLRKHAHMILAGFHQRLQNETGCVEVCSPAICRTEQERHDPEQALFAMRTCERASSVGGWHIVGRDDYATYALVSHLHKMEDKVDDHARRLLKAHPVWPALSFIPHLNVDRCCQLLATVVDPRWFVSPFYPGRGARLRSYLGLDLKTTQGVLGLGPKTRLHERCKVVYDSWHGPHDPKLIERPDNFLLRVARAHEEKSGEAVAVLRASQMFVDYLRLIWLAVLGRMHGSREALFVPKYFFNGNGEAEAFSEHVRKHFGD
jgi:hypothetical protein